MTIFIEASKRFSYIILNLIVVNIPELISRLLMMFKVDVSLISRPLPLTLVCQQFPLHICKEQETMILTQGRTTTTTQPPP